MPKAGVLDPKAGVLAPNRPVLPDAGVAPKEKAIQASVPKSWWKLSCCEGGACAFQLCDSVPDRALRACAILCTSKTTKACAIKPVMRDGGCGKHDQNPERGPHQRPAGPTLAVPTLRPSLITPPMVTVFERLLPRLAVLGAGLIREKLVVIAQPAG